jgi:hypothetical protein
MCRHILAAALLLQGIIGSRPPALAADATGAWGDLALRVVFDGDKLPQPKPVSAAAGVMFCGGVKELLTDDLLVNPKDRGVANVFVYLYEEAAEISIHPQYSASAKKEAVMANRGCAFVPKAIAMRLSQTFVGTNPDPVGHNMQLNSFDNPSFNLAVPAGGKITNVFKVAEIAPLPVRCTSHTWMAGFVLVRGDPYAGVTDASGRVKLGNLPVGKWKFRIWHERCGFVTKATIGGKAVEWPRGRVEWEIKPGANDLGELLIKPAVFKEKE